mgnify:CR=1 FL=1
MTKIDTITGSLLDTFAQMSSQALKSLAARAHRMGWRSILSDIRAEFRARKLRRS